jgi:hypothetical protein
VVPSVVGLAVVAEVSLAEAVAVVLLSLALSLVFFSPVQAVRVRRPIRA